MNKYFIYAFIASIILCLISSIQSVVGQDSNHNLTSTGQISGVIALIVSCISCGLCVYGAMASE